MADYYVSSLPVDVPAPVSDERAASQGYASSGGSHSQHWPSSFERGISPSMLSMIQLRSLPGVSPPKSEKSYSRRSSVGSNYTYLETGGADRKRLPAISDIGESSELLVGGVPVESGEFIQTKQKKSTFAQGVFNSINLLLGVGLLSLPYSLCVSGWSIGLPLLVFLCIVTNYTGKLLGRCMDSDPENIRTYPDIASAAFGKTGRIFISVVFFFELLVACTSFLVLMTDSLMSLYHDLFDGHHWPVMLIMTAVVLPSTYLKNLAFLSYLSVIGVISSVWLMGAIIYQGASIKEPPGSFIHPASTSVVKPITEFPLAFGLIMVGFAGHAIFPTLKVSLREPKRFERMLDIAYALVAPLYITIMVLGYLMFGENTEDEITKNLAHNLRHGESVVINIAMWLIVINPATKFALTLSPVSLSIEEIILPRVSSRLQLPVSLLVRTFLCLLTCTLGIVVPNFGKLVAFIGALFSFTVSMSFPPFLYLKIFRGELSKWEVVLNWMLGIIGIIMGITGTIAALAY